MTRQGDRSGPLDQYGYTSDYAGRRLEDTPDALNAPRQQAGRARKGRNETGKEMISSSCLTVSGLGTSNSQANDGSSTVTT